MSADNGIYILACKDQYRVIHAMAIDNLYWSFLKHNNNTELVPTRIVEYFGKSKYTRDINKAREIAFNMEKKHPILEYGIRTINVNKTWKQIVREAKELAPKEIEDIKNNFHKDGRWNSNIEQLKEIMSI